MNASLIPSKYESGAAGLEPEMKKGMEYHNAHAFNDSNGEVKTKTVAVAFQKVVFFDDLGITLNE